MSLKEKEQYYIDFVKPEFNIVLVSCTTEYKHSDLTKQKISFSIKKCGNKLKTASKIVLNTSTGVFYDSLLDAANTINFNAPALGRKLNGIRKNNTDFIFV